MSRWHQQSDEIFEIIIRDSSGRKIDTFKGSMKDFHRISNMIKGKYGLFKKKEDLDWLRDDR